jgi:hypothetical protein
MEREQLRRRIHRAHTELRHLPPGSDERRKLAQALDEMEDEYSSRQAWIRGHLQESSEDGGPIEIVAEAREALQRASFYLAHPTADATLGEAIAEIERVLRPPQGVPGPDAGALDPPSPTAPRLCVTSALASLSAQRIACCGSGRAQGTKRDRRNLPPVAQDPRTRRAPGGFEQLTSRL